MRKINVDLGMKVFILIDIGLFIISIFFFAAALAIDRKIRATSRMRRKNSTLVITKILQMLIRFLMPRENSITYKRIYLQLREAGIKWLNSVQRLYLIKIITPLIIIIPILLVAKYNIDYSNLSIIRQFENNRLDLVLNEQKVDNSEEYIKEKQAENESHFKIVKENFNIRKLKGTNSANQIAEVLAKKANLSLYDSKLAADSIQKKISNLTGHETLYIIAFITVFIGFNLPNMILFLVHKYRSIGRETEKLMITELVISLGNIHGIQVYEIIKKLSEVTRIYKYLFVNCLDDLESGIARTALLKLKDNTNDQDIVDLGDFLLAVQEKLDINEAISDYEYRQFEKKQSLEAMENIKQERVMAVATFFISTSIFIVILSIVISMASMFNMLGL